MFFAALALAIGLFAPGNPAATVHYRSLNPANGAAVRWVSNVNAASDGSLWWRWQFSARPNQNYYDVMFWATDGTLRYASTNEGCSKAGDKCNTVTSFDPPIGFGPKNWHGELRTASGISTITKETCSGTVNWSWTIKPASSSEIIALQIRTDLPLAKVSINEKFTGGCGTFTWAEDWWWGTACKQNVCISGPIQSKGGQLPWAPDSSHWFMTFEDLTLD